MSLNVCKIVMVTKKKTKIKYKKYTIDWEQHNWVDYQISHSPDTSPKIWENNYPWALWILCFCNHIYSCLIYQWIAKLSNTLIFWVLRLPMNINIIISTCQLLATFIVYKLKRNHLNYNSKITCYILKWSSSTSNILDNLGLGAPWDRFCCIKSFAFRISSFLLINLAKNLQKFKLEYLKTDVKLERECSEWHL